MKEYKPLEITDEDYSTEEVYRKWEKNAEQLKKIDKEAAKYHELVGRYITQPFADGSAVYIITKVKGNTVRVKVCTGLGDDWVLPQWGEETDINRGYANRALETREGMAALFVGGV